VVASGKMWYRSFVELLSPSVSDVGRQREEARKYDCENC